MSRELSSFNPPDRVLEQLAELAARFIPVVRRYCTSPPLTDKHDLVHCGDACHPGISDQQEIESSNRQMLPGLADTARDSRHSSSRLTSKLKSAASS